MNRSLLLVICDFLILSLLALATFDQAGADDLEPLDEVVEMENVQAEQDLMEALKLSLEEERATRQELSGDLDLTQQALLEREETLAEREARLEALAADLERREAERLRLEQERASLEEQFTETRAEKEELAQERARQEEAARRARELALAMERELQQKLAELETNRQDLVQLEGLQREAEEENRRLASELQLSDSEKRLIRENLEYVRSEVAVVRAEKDRIQEQAGQLAQGVTTLAERSGELVEEVRRSQPKTANTIFSEFQANQLTAAFSRSRPQFRRVHETETRSILVTAGDRIYALFHLADLGLAVNDPVEWESLTGRLSLAEQWRPIQELYFLSIDPRILVVEIDPASANRFGTKVYQLAQEPFRFPEAVLINSGGQYYGESTFTVDPENRRYVQMPRRIMTRLFGEFAPSTGDLVFSKTDELIGIMVNNEYCALIDNFLPVPGQKLPMGDNLTGTQRTLVEIKQRVERLPLRFR